MHKMATLTCIYDKQGVHNVLGRVPGPRRVIVQNANKLNKRQLMNRTYLYLYLYLLRSRTNTGIYTPGERARI